MTDSALQDTAILLNGSIVGEFLSVPSPRVAAYRLSSTSPDVTTAATLKATWDRLAAPNDPQPRKLTLAVRDASKRLFVVGETNVLTNVAVARVKLFGKETSAGLGEIVDVGLHLPVYLKQSLSLGSNQDLLLFFNGRPVGAFDSQPENATFRFKLGVKGWSVEASKTLEHSWKLLMNELDDDESVEVAIGTLALGPSLHAVDRLKFDRFDNSQVISGVLVGVLLLAVFSIGLKRSNWAVLREEGDFPPSTAAGTKKAFSLARCQMAWWFLLVLLVVLLHWSLVGELAALPANILLLIGVSAGTGYLARAVDGDRAARPTSGFLTDLLTSGGEPGLHRLQMIVWTVVLGSYFFGKFIQTLWAPDLDLNWIGLMGLTSGVYVGFKIQEKK